MSMSQWIRSITPGCWTCRATMSTGLEGNHSLKLSGIFPETWTAPESLQRQLKLFVKSRPSRLTPKRCLDVKRDAEFAFPRQLDDHWIREPSDDGFRKKTFTSSQTFPDDRVNTSSFQCNSHVQHGAEQHVLLRDVSPEAGPCPTQTGVKISSTRS